MIVLHAGAVSLQRIDSIMVVFDVVRDIERVMISNEEVNRMRWASRRGMLELDLVLEPFVSSRYRSLNERDRQRFQDLMLCEDQDLFGWFLRREQPQDEELAAIVATILEFARSPAEPSSI